LTSSLKSDYGNIYYEGLELTSNINKIRKNIGVCFQDNIIFDDLLVEENIKIYAGIKGTDSNVENILDDVILKEKRYCKAKELSGGQK